MKIRFRKKIVLIVIFIILLGLKKSNAVETSTLPSSFDLRDEITIKVENQGNLGTCWAFASLNSLETYLSLNGYGDYDFSESHLAYLERGFNQQNGTLENGGWFESFINYCTNGKGPVLESEIPYYKNNIEGANYTENDLEFLESAEKIRICI